jgi:PAS domain S-box-containing protein
MLSDLKVLIIDDDEDDFFITNQYMQEIQSINVTCTWCYNTIDAQNRLRSNEYDIYFLDYRLGARTGVELLKDAIANGTYKPIILLTGKGTPEIDQAAVEAGAYDYLIKSELTSEKLERCIRYAIERYKQFKVINDNERKFRLIFENAMSFIFTCNELLHFTNCNAASAWFLGYTPEELNGTSIFNYIEESDERNEFLKQVQAKKPIRDYNLKFMSKIGEVKTGNISLNYFETGDIEAHWQGIIFDETIRAQMEQNRLQSEKLEATYRLVRTLAHEIRNPLTNIGLAIDGLSDRGLDESQNQYVDIVKRGSRRINDIISELLQSSKAVELKPEPVDLNELIQEVLQVAQDRIELKNIRTSINLLDFPVVRKLDKEKFKIAILNLVVNAIEAMDKQDSELSISLTKNHEQTVIQVKDNGSGISEEQLKRLFEPYFTTKKTGMGLGLVSTLNIIKSHEASIEVDSKPEVGTTFKVVFAD